jgi:NAD(P)-dependent dehydrogenase (short-subunit alcohol dehydrogenase family)
MTTLPADSDGLADKVAIIAGGGAVGDGIGNGRAAAILLARSGAKVMVADQEAARAARTAEMITSEGGTAHSFGGDLTDAKVCEELVADTVARFGRLDLLDNNIGIAGKGSVVTESQATWQRMMRINVEAMFLMSKAAIPAMIATAKGGSIVNISSISALRPRGLTIYTTTKAAVIGLTRAMAIDHARDGIRVNCVAPGPVYTPMVYAPGMSAKARDTRRRASALGLEGTGWDIGNAVRFLLSDHARYITGQTLVVDGGVTLQAPERESDTE